MAYRRNPNSGLEITVREYAPALVEVAEGRE